MKKYIAFLFLIATTVLFSANCYAYNDEDTSINSIRFYSPSSCPVNDSTNRTTYIEGLTEDSLLVEWVSKNYASVTSLSAEYGLPWEPIMAQGAIESSYGTTEAYELHRNIFVLGADGGGLNRDASYPDIESSWRVIFEYWRLNAGAYRDRIFSKETYNNLDLYIDAIVASGYQAGNASYTEELRSLTAEIDTLTERSGLLSSKEISKESLVVEKNIERNQGIAASSSGNFSDQSTTECNCGGDASASGVRWSNFWISNNSLYGSQKAPVIGMAAERRLNAKDYGLSLDNTELKLSFRIKNGEGSIVDGDPYVAYPNADYPHFLVDIKKKRVFQYLPINVSAATKSDKNVENGIVVDIVGFEEDNGSNYYLWNQEKVESPEWRYLAKIVEAISEETSAKIQPPAEGTGKQIWDKISKDVNLSEHKASIKCATLGDADNGLSEYEAKRLVNHYKNSVSLNTYDLPLNSKEMPASFVAYFVERFTLLDAENVNWGEPYEVVANITKSFPMLESGSDPEVYSVFSSTNSSLLCGGINCGSTGVILNVENGLATTVEQSYPSGKLSVRKRSLAELKNNKFGVSFVYLRPVLNDNEIKLGKMGQ